MTAQNNNPGDFFPVLRFAVASDAHIKEPGDAACRKLTKLFQTIDHLNSADNSYPRTDAFVMAGDTANSGTAEQFDAFFGILAAHKKPETRFLGLMAKYHDCGQGRSAVADFTRRTGQPADFHTVINGFHFIGISVCPDPEVFHYSDHQKQWLDSEIFRAVSDTPNLPVFVFQHEHVRDTVFGSSLFDGWGENYFSDIYKKYPNIVNISGHSHYPASDPRAVWQGEFTAVNDGGLSYFEFTFDGERKYHPANAADMAQFLLAEADRHGAVRIRVYDLNIEKFVCDWFIENASDPSAFIYSHARRTEKALPPFFEDGAQLRVSKTETGCTVTVPPAKTGKDDRVFLYRLFAEKPDGSSVLSDKHLSDYYCRTNPENIVFNCALPEGKYTFKVTAQSVWEKQSEPLKKDVNLE